MPARVVGERHLHICDDSIETYVGSVLANTLSRVYIIKQDQRGRCIDYSHVIVSWFENPGLPPLTTAA